MTVAEQQLLWAPQKNPIITLDLSGIAAMKDWNVSTIEAVAPVSAFDTELDKHGFTIKVPAAFVSLGRSPQNFAERLFAKAFVLGASFLAGKRLSDAEVEQAIESLQISPNERHMHTLVATDHRDYVRGFGERDFELTKDADIHFADAGIGYEAGMGNQR